MRLLSDDRDVQRVRELLPPSLLAAEFSWQVVESLSYERRCDLFYFDTIDAKILSCLPALLRGLDEQRCYIWNRQAIRREITWRGRDFGIEILSSDAENSVEHQFGIRNADRWLDIFHLSGVFGIVSPANDWLVLAETDERAVLLARHDIKFATFSAVWWPRVLERIRSVPLPTWSET